jgi:hypothetical protein
VQFSLSSLLPPLSRVQIFWRHLCHSSPGYFNFSSRVSR